MLKNVDLDSLLNEELVFQKKVEDLKESYIQKTKKEKAKFEAQIADLKTEVASSQSFDVSANQKVNTDEIKVQNKVVDKVLNKLFS